MSEPEIGEKTVVHDSGYYVVMRRAHSQQAGWVDYSPNYWGEAGLTAAEATYTTACEALGADEVRLVHRQVVTTETMIV